MEGDTAFHGDEVRMVAEMVYLDKEGVYIKWYSWGIYLQCYPIFTSANDDRHNLEGFVKFTTRISTQMI